MLEPMLDEVVGIGVADAAAGGDERAEIGHEIHRAEES
jgi:hypothetical protein